MTRYFIRLSFKGTGYAGWQIQANAIAVQEILNNCMKILLKHDVVTTGCGRTDTGVHARQFYVHFDTESDVGDAVKFIYSLNAILPNDIVVHELIQVENNAHARFDAVSRTYEYFIATDKNPFLKEFAMFAYGSYNIEKMNAACSHLLSHSDFTSFSKSHTQVKSNICNVSSAYWEERGNLLVFTITADRFLRGMVRAITGSMLEIGASKKDPDVIVSILKSKNRSEAGVSVPACGLYLTEIVYPYLKRVIFLNFPA